MMNIAHFPAEKIQKQPRKQFTFEEDKMLKKAVSDIGDNNWDKVAALLPNRTPRQCRDRWNKYLSPNIRGSMWTDEEDQMLLSLIQSYGNKWSKIATFIKGRSDISIKNRYKQLISQSSQSFQNHLPISNKIEVQNNMNHMHSSNTLQNNNNSNINSQIETTSHLPHPKPRHFLKTIVIDPIIAENSSNYNTKAIEQLRELFESLGPIEPRPCSRPSLKM